MKGPKKAKKHKPTKAQVSQRVDEILRIRLDGAALIDVREYVREAEARDGSPWKLDEGQKPLSDSQLWRYIARADKLMTEECRADREKLLGRHLAQRRNLYAKAVLAGDYRAALAAADSEAKLLNLFPATRLEHEHKGEVLILTEEIVDSDDVRAATANNSATPGTGAVSP
jgi:hypothetical protein